MVWATLRKALAAQTGIVVAMVVFHVVHSLKACATEGGAAKESPQVRDGIVMAVPVQENQGSRTSTVLKTGVGAIDIDDDEVGCRTWTD